MASASGAATPSWIDQVAQAVHWNPAVLLAQYNLETGNGTSPVWLQDQNPAGIKYVPGELFAIPGLAAPHGGQYAKFSNPALGWATFIADNPRYLNVSSTQNPAQEAALLQQDGWSNSPTYASQLDSLMGVKPVTHTSKVSSSQTYGVTGISGTAAAIGWTIGGIALILGGIWLLFNPFADLTTALRSAANTLGSHGQRIARAPLAKPAAAIAGVGRRAPVKPAPRPRTPRWEGGR